MLLWTQDDIPINTPSQRNNESQSSITLLW